ncbi:MAG TPA: ACT domain-containing protein [Azospirillaceae bacterium]|nr:ACT domain-containing protein [Azospirillaceae bacterium]
MPETDLARLIATMRPALVPGRFVFATLPEGTPPPAGVAPVMLFREAEGTTLVLAAEEAERAGLAGIFPCRQITLTVHSALDAVGFLAAVTATLAAAGISTNAVAAYHHDHLFVPEARAEEAVALLEAMAAGK